MSTDLSIDHRLTVECSGYLQSSIEENVVFQMNLLAHFSVQFLQPLTNLPVSSARGRGGVIVFCKILDPGQEIPYRTMLMCHVRQIIAYAVHMDRRGTAAHIGQFKFSNLRKQYLRLIRKMRRNLMRKRCRKVSDVDCVGMFPKMARTHSTSQLLNAWEILLNQNRAGPKQISHQCFQDWVCPRSFCCAACVDYAIQFAENAIHGQPQISAGCFDCLFSMAAVLDPKLLEHFDCRRLAVGYFTYSLFGVDHFCHPCPD